jgi:hypothetical protein
MLNVIMLSAVVLSIVMLNVVAPILQANGKMIGLSIHPRTIGHQWWLVRLYPEVKHWGRGQQIEHISSVALSLKLS